VIAQTATATAFNDFAHSPSKVKATIEAMKGQFPERKLIACYELHTFSSLTESFLPEYKNTMQQADVAIVYYNHEVIKQKQQKTLDENQIITGFGREDLKIFSDIDALKRFLTEQNYTNTTLLMMSSGNFSGANLPELAHQLLNQ
jgi:UDP-N-acetylmuramate: L-alanyl-gamma-D-glutamyl-meso-diaminopimelate ligase